MVLEVASQSRCFGGMQLVYRHTLVKIGTQLQCSIYVPPQGEQGRVPVVWFLSGLICIDENFTMKAGAQRVAAELDLMMIAPDASPQGDGVPDDPEGAYDLGLGTRSYVDAIREPWLRNYRMRSCIEKELPALIASDLPADMSRQSILGHSMGGHGALTIALRNPGRFAAVSALAPISSPMNCPWGEKAFTSYLGPDREAWRSYDSCALMEDGHCLPELLVDYGTADPFLVAQLKPDLLETACFRAPIPLTRRINEGYNHSYFFIASVIEDHLRWHAERLGRQASPHGPIASGHPDRGRLP
jgi:S-formylglutathione hydrolase